MSKTKQQPISFTGFDGVSINTHHRTNSDITSVLRSLFYWLFMLLSIAIFIIGLLAATGYLPQQFLLFSTDNFQVVQSLPTESHISKQQTESDASILNSKLDSQLLPTTNNTDLSINDKTLVSQDEQVKQIQILLLELGYKPGKVDGPLGEKSQEAINQFQSDYSVEVPIEDLGRLSSSLQKHAPEMKHLPEGFTSLKISLKRKVIVPTNARFAKVLNDWVCKFGFRRIANRCVLLSLPDKAFLYDQGDDWQCLPGYKKTKNRCQSIPMPANALLNYSATGWECIRGYKKTGNLCTLITIPKNASLNDSGNEWECDTGFTKEGQKCAETKTDQ